MKSQRRIQLSITVLPDLLPLADAQAAAERLTRSRWIERLIERAVSRKKNL